jgi:hypothetical protein
MERKLTHSRVTEVYAACTAPRWTRMGTTEVGGAIASHTLLDRRLTRDRAAIVEMAGALPAGFRADGGGGGSMAAMVLDAEGVVWTTEMPTVEKLAVLLIGARVAHWTVPRARWHRLPGGLPYLTVTMPGVIQ